ncbi:bacterial extracellular solute-binding s, 5 Middle family protein, partial [Vibrio parahaemolyticus V-223/04]
RFLTLIGVSICVVAYASIMANHSRQIVL